ncbi:MAG: CHC2 zinc finger domain-containing protein [Blautia sp.]|nr:CHC2 zinc finger domain-containing protein [Blautia sp.]
MTREEIKAAYTMRDILARYGLQADRAGFIRCPFHTGDREASLKVYDKDFHCFGCGANGDIFDFVMKMDGLSFPEAFQLLGGTYERQGFKGKLAIYRAEKRREMADKQRRREEDRKSLNNILITVYRRHIERSEPFSEGWCSSMNELQRQLRIHDYLNEPR